MFFEQYPWLLVPIIIATVEAWSLAKTRVRAVLERRRDVSQQSNILPD